MHAAHQKAPRPVLTRVELARALDVGHDTIGRLVREGRIPYLRVGRQLRFILDDVLTALRECGFRKV